MSAWSGKFQYLNSSGTPVSQGPCQLTFDSETAIVTPEGSTPITFDLGDVDRAVPGEWDLQLVLYTGHTVILKHFGASFSDMARELLDAWRDRTVRCLLLEDLEEIGRYNGAADGTPAEIRILKSNLAVIPQSGPPVQWRLADIDSLRFDESSYRIVLESGARKLILGKLAKKTDEAMGRLCAAVDALHTRTAQTLHSVFPFLSADCAAPSSDADARRAQRLASRYGGYRSENSRGAYLGGCRRTVEPLLRCPARSRTGSPAIRWIQVHPARGGRGHRTIRSRRSG